MEDNKVLQEKAYQLAYDYDLQFGCCPQCVLAAVNETIGGIPDDLIKAAHSLSGGGGLIGEGTCGALAGGLLAIGVKHGRSRERFGKGRFLKNFQLSKELMDKFKEEWNGSSCHHIQEKYTGRTWNMWDPDEIVEFKKTDCKEECARLTGLVAKWVVEMLG